MPSHMKVVDVRFVLNIQPAAAAANWRAWLTQVLNVSADELPAEEGSVSLRLAEGSLLMVRSLLEAIKWPVFQLGQLVDIQPDPRHTEAFIVSAQLPYLDNTDPDCYRLAISCAATWLPSLAQQSVSPSAVDKLYAAIERDFIQPLKSKVPGGKSTYQVLRVAHQMQIPFMHLGGGVYQLGWGQQLQLIDRSATVADAAIGARVAQDKAVSALFLRRAGLPAGAHQLVRAQGLSLIHISEPTRR
jgi:cyanophycin synthetase